MGRAGPGRAGRSRGSRGTRAAAQLLRAYSSGGQSFADSVTFGIQKLINLRGGDFRCLCSPMFTADWSWRVNGLYFMNVTLLRREGKRRERTRVSAEC